MATVELHEQQWKKFSENDYAVIDCYGENCTACVMLEPVFDAVADELAGVSFGRINISFEPEIADTYGDRIAAGSKAVVKIGNDKLDGVVSDVTPLSKNGVISFTVQLEEDNHRRLRSGLKTDVYVMNAIKDDVLRISNASFYVGKGEYELFVVNGDQLIKRKVQLGDSNFEYVEVVGGLEPGDEVVVSDMTSFKEKNKLKLK